MKGDAPRSAVSPQLGITTHEQEQPLQQGRGYVASRNEKLHLIARQKRQPIRASAGDAAVDKQSAAAAGRNAVRRSLPNLARPKVVKLSAVLQQAPQHFDRVKVAAVERMLTDIDDLPQQFQSAEIVYLSKNCLTHLEGIEQFQRLRVLSAADNLLPDISCLEILTVCPNLQVASFERNPLTGLPNYRQKVLQLLPKLENLDGQVVTAQERSRVAHVLQQEAACMAVMLSNACMVHKLARSAELLQLHAELRRTMFGTSSLARMTRGVLPSYIPLDLLKFLKLWDYEGGLTAEERRVISDALTREVTRVHKQLQQAAATLKGPAQLPALQAWDTAFAKVMLAQQRTIIQLVELVNVLHGEAASLVSKLTGQQAVTASELQQLGQQQEPERDTAGDCDRQLLGDQRLAQEREDLIIDLRDAALELAGLVAAGETSSPARQYDSSADVADTCPSPRQLLQQRQMQQQQQQQVAAAAAGSSSRVKQQPRGSAASLRRVTSGDSYESLRLRHSPKPDRASAAAAAGAAAARELAGRLSQSPAGRAAGLTSSPGGGGARQQQLHQMLGSPQQLQQQQQMLDSPQQTQQQQRSGGRYDGLLYSQSPSPEPSQTFGGAAVDPTSPEFSPAGSTSSHGSPSKAHSGPRSPTARRLLQHAQQQQQHWDAVASSQERQHVYVRESPGAAAAAAAAAGSPQGLALTEQPSDQWLDLQQMGSAQHLLAALESSPPRGTPARSMGLLASPEAAAMGPSPRSTGMRAAAAAAAAPGTAGSSAAPPRPSMQGRGVGRVAHTPSLVSPASSPESPVRDDIGVQQKALQPWGSRIQSRPESTSSSWHGSSMPMQQQQQQQMYLQVDEALEEQLAAQDSLLGRSNPVQSPAEWGQAYPLDSPAGNSSRSRVHAAGAYRGDPALVSSSAPVSPNRQGWPGAAPAPVHASPAVSEPAAYDRGAVAAASAADHAGLWGGTRSSSMPPNMPQQMAQQAAAAGVGAGGAVSPNAGSSPRTLRKSVSWADRPLQPQQEGTYTLPSPQQQPQQPPQQQQMQANTQGAYRPDVPPGQLFADDMVPGACSMYSPYLPASLRQQTGSQQQYSMQAVAVGPAEADCMSAAGNGPPGSAAAAPPAGRGSRYEQPSPRDHSPAPSVSPALSGTGAGAGAPSDAVGVLELSELSGMSNASPSSVQFGGQGTPKRMHFNALYSAFGEPERSEHSDDIHSGQCSTPASGLSVAAGGVYETRDLSRPRVASGSRGPHGGHTGSPGAHCELSFAMQGGSPGSSSLGESGAWLQGQGQRGVAGLLGQLQQQPQQGLQQHGQQGVQQQSQQQDRQLLWNLLHDDDDNMQLESPSTGEDSSNEAREGVLQGVAPQAPAATPGGLQQAELYSSTSAAPAAAHDTQANMPEGPRLPAASMQGLVGVPQNTAPAAAAAAGGDAGPLVGAPGSAVPARMAAAGASGVGPGMCASSRGSFSSSMDLSPIKRQLFRSVSHSCHSLLQNAAGLSNIAAQLDAAAGAAGGHGQQEAAQAGRQALMAQQQRLDLQNRVQQGGLSQQLLQQPAGRPPQQQVQQGNAGQGLPQGPVVTLHGVPVSSAAVRKFLSSSAETASSWAASSITPYVNEATAAAEAALAAAEAAQQLSTSCPPALMMQAYGMQGPCSLLSDTETGSGSSGLHGEAAAASSTAAVAPQQQHGVLMGLTPVVPWAVDRSAAAAASAHHARSPSTSEANKSPRLGPAGGEPVAKALFPAADGVPCPTVAVAAVALAGSDAGAKPGSGAAAPAGAATHDLWPAESTASAQAVAAGSSTHAVAAAAAAAGGPPVHAQGTRQGQTQAGTGAGSAPASPAAAATNAARASASSLPASPAPAAAAAAAAAGLAVPGVASGTAAASSLPASPAAAAAAVLNLRSSPRDGLGPRSTAALAELQSQLLTLAVEKAALQRQLHNRGSQVERLQEKACKSDQLEQVVHQMRGDLQQATQMLEHTGGAVHEQASLNQQLQQQMQQLQQQLLATEAERSRQAAAETLAKISLCRRVLHHFADAAAVVGEWRRLKQTARQRGQLLVLRRAISTWRATLQQSKAVASLQLQHNQRRMAAVLAVWAQAAWEQRVTQIQYAAADAHFARSTCRRALGLWLFYSQQASLLGVQLPSPSSTASSGRCSPAAAAAGFPTLPVSTPASTSKLVSSFASAAGATSWGPEGGRSSSSTWHQTAGATGRSAARSLGPSFGLGSLRIRGEQQHQQQQQQQLEAEEDEPGQLLERQPAKFAHAAKQRLSAGLVTLTERLSEALSPPRGSRQQQGAEDPAAAAAGEIQWPLHAGRHRSTIAGYEQQQYDAGREQRHAAGGGVTSPFHTKIRSISVPGADTSAGISGAATSAGTAAAAAPRLQPVAEAPGACVRPAAAMGAARRSGVASHRASAVQLGASRDLTGSLSVPLALQASFVHASRSQRLRQRWLLVKAFNRWGQLLVLRAAEDSRVAAAARYAARRQQRRAWGAWRGLMQQQQHQAEALLEAERIAQQHVKSQQQRLLVWVLAAWRSLCTESGMLRRTAQLLARQQRRNMQRQVFATLSDHAALQAAKRFQQQRAKRHHAGVLLQKAWGVWKDSIGLSQAAAAWQAHHSQQLLARVVCRWQQLSAALMAAAVARATESRMQHLQHRRKLRVLRSAYSSWRVAAAQAAAEAATQAASAAEQQMQRLQMQRAQDELQLQQLAVVLHEKAELQQQLAAANAAKLELQYTVDRQEAQLQHEASQHQQQLAALESEHQMGVTVLQVQLQQACAHTDETMQQLQQLQQQQSDQLARQQQLEQQVAQQKYELEQQARQQLQRLDQQQQQWNQQQRQDHQLVEQLANRKAQCQELALQLKRCTEKLNGQTAAVQTVKAELADTQHQLAAARALSRNKGLTLTEKAVKAERDRSELAQQLAQAEGANQQLQQQLAEVQKQLKHQRAHVEARRVSATAEQRAEVLRLQEALAHKEDVIAQLKDSMGAVQAQLASEQVKVVSEISQLRNGWSQAKAIIKQQRKTIKAQELQLQLLGTPTTWQQQQAQAQPRAAVPPQQQYSANLSAPATQQQQQVQHAGTGPPQCMAETSDSVLKYPITSWVLQSQQQQQGPGLYQQHVPATAPAAAAAAAAGSAPAMPSAVSTTQQRVYQGAGTSSAAGHGATAGLHGHVGGPAGLSVGGVPGSGVQSCGEQRQQTVLARTSELLQCTDDILKTLRSRTAQC